MENIQNIHILNDNGPFPFYIDWVVPLSQTRILPNLVVWVTHNDCLVRNRNCLPFASTCVHLLFFLWGPFCPSFKFSVMGVLFVCFVCLRPVSHVPNVTCISRLSILDSPSDFSNVYKLSMTYFSKLIHDFNYIVVFSNIHVNQFFFVFSVLYCNFNYPPTL